ncbi:G-type lectin S-receptor-like serine/threonine-protein kinase At4g03230 isoform X1 [Humulus lupulus]|uniref:G-type lectin S-receptor-like serine/threonine-protein kinase At4g03230 isoform X1 n=2 Tax=Humulus lupulus TaxID=3486 RepID=UPI002B4098AE|nr:G-type lectin S-receptor-like serine/threonine-protein kinase At4g03230 isoform X1 [Humulus lupulus]XP_062084146.1 G-type lectin S-receptor-like serine/threonine-protein kinase At4g03230 isoform X1 [Humulus lupulus]XP_062084147.1 G-type lectin S-receptor-like serine/threonine-protein kinase At4g03230 isoform X1 [Humulus lupulus]
MDIKTNSRSLLVLFICLFLKTNLSFGADTISASQSLSGDQTIVSKGGVFTLGFFDPGDTSKFYIGMWYTKIKTQTIVWVANREQPVLDRFSSEVKISDGNLVLFDESKLPIWSTNVSSTSSSPVQAVLGDNGNLVLSDGSNSSNPLWQSFDNPTHTFLPGSKISYNKITKTYQVLTSWKNSIDPSPGLFTLQLDETDNSFIILRDKSRRYWTSGPWNGRIFSFFNVVSNENESYFTYSVKPTSTITSRLVMDVSGQIKQLNYLPDNGWTLSWSQPRTQCQTYAFCGPYGSCDSRSLPYCKCLRGFKPTSQSDWDLKEYSGGCTRVSQLKCGNDSLPDGEKDRFLEMPNMLLPDNNRILRKNIHSLDLWDSDKCKSRCLNICSCTAYAFQSNSCSIWLEDVINLLAAGDDSTTIYVKLAASEFQDHKNKVIKFLKSKILYVVLGIIAAAILILSIVCSLYYQRRKKKIKSQGDKKKTWGKQVVGLYDTEKQIANHIKSCQFGEDEREGIDVPFVDLETIVMATDNFLDANKLGQGGFGPVYKGKLRGGQEIAIKRLSSGSRQGLEEFKNEVMLIAKLQHRNLVKLLGYCVEGEEKLLLYEYMPNKSLDSFIFDQTLRVLLNWELRFDIILGIARGLLYLHHDSRLRIIHRDLKTSNVLLDEEMNPKISDFGLARIFGGKQTEASTRRVVGTYGYMSPEYALDGIFSIKSDVFSFGVMLLEIVSGKRNTGFYQSEQALSLLGYAWKLWRDNKALDLMDATLSESCNTNEFMKCVNVGLLCVQDDPSDRPTMPNVVFMLGNETASLSNPKQPAFVAWRSISTSASPNKPLSVNELTTSLEHGR